MHTENELSVKNIIIVSGASDAGTQSVVVALRRSILEAGCSAEHLRWQGCAAEHSLSCASCQNDGQCAQADPADLALKRVKAADASVFIVDETACGASSFWLPLLLRFKEEPGLILKPRYLVITSAARALLPLQMTELMQKAARDLQASWSSITLICAGSPEQAQNQALILGQQWARRLAGE